jgi:elongation factor G
MIGVTYYCPKLATQKRTELIEQLADVDDEIVELFLNDALPSNAQLAAAVRWVTVSLKFSPVVPGCAIKNTAVQPLLDGVCVYLVSVRYSAAHEHTTGGACYSGRPPCSFWIP